MISHPRCAYDCPLPSLTWGNSAWVESRVRLKGAKALGEPGKDETGGYQYTMRGPPP